MRFVVLTATILVSGCFNPGDGDILNPLESGELSDSDKIAIANAFIGVVNGVNDDFGSSGELTIQGPDTDPSPGAAVKLKIALNGAYRCRVAGRISWTGNVSVDTDAGSIFGLIALRISDATNNLNDCEPSRGVILEGSLTLTFAGTTASGVGASMSGNIEINSRGNGGGLVPRGSCFVSISVPRGGTRATGSVCGRAI
jgi:hypothetical protein